MKRMIHGMALVALIAGLVLGALVGCQKANPDDTETQALAKQFVNAVFDTHETDLAMSFVGPIRTYPYVTREDVESTIQDFVKKRCATVANSEGVGKPGADLFIPEISAADTAKGITARIAWLVASKYRCGSQNYDADSITLVFLEKINGKWVITKCMFYYGTVSDFVG